MSWADVQTKFKFYGPSVDDLGNETGLDGTPETVNGLRATDIGGSFGLTEKNSILGTLEFLYANSDDARAVLDAIDSRDVWLLKSVSGSSVPVFNPCQVVAVDLAEATSLQWMGSNGRLQTETLAVTLIHELTHAILGYPDLVDPKGQEYAQNPGLKKDYNAPNFDHVGQTQTLTNAVLRDIYGESTAYQQVGYDAVVGPSNENYLRSDISYSEDRAIEIAYFDNEGPIRTTSAQVMTAQITDTDTSALIRPVRSDEGARDKV